MLASFVAKESALHIDVLRLKGRRLTRNLAGHRLIGYVQLHRQRWLNAHFAQQIAQPEHPARDLARGDKLILHLGQRHDAMFARAPTDFHAVQMQQSTRHRFLVGSEVSTAKSFDCGVAPLSRADAIAILIFAIPFS